MNALIELQIAEEKDVTVFHIGCLGNSALSLHDGIGDKCRERCEMNFVVRVTLLHLPLLGAAVSDLELCFLDDVLLRPCNQHLVLEPSGQALKLGVMPLGVMDGVQQG